MPSNDLLDEPRPSRRFRRAKANEPAERQLPKAHRPKLGRKRSVAVGAVVVASLLAGSAAVGARSDSSASYRTAVAGTHTVDQVLEAVGTIEPVSEASVAFPVDGTVSSVSVEVGDTVAVGEELASLDVEDLTTSLHEAQATLTQAELNLSLALAGEDVSGSSGGGGSTTGALARSTASASSTALSAAQQAVLDAQKAVDAAMLDAEAAMKAATTVCTPSEVAAADDDASGDTGADATDTSTEDLTACQQALESSLAAQQAVTDAQKELVTASNALTDLLADLADDASADTTTTTTAPASDSGGSTTSPSSSGSGSTTSGSVPSDSSASGSATPSGSSEAESSSPTAADLIAYQAKVDAATVAVDVAQQAVDQASIVSPIAGTVVSVGFAEGDEATAASATQAIVVVGKGGMEVTTSVSVTDLPDVEVGEKASVTPDGSDDAVEGEVVSIGAAPDTSSGTSTYTVTISLTGDTSDLGNGSLASVEIVTQDAGRALAVPTSAVSVDGDRATVQVVTDGKAKVTTVEIGAIGQTYTEITSGLDVGDVVVLADLSEALPGSATSSSNASSSGSGGPGGGGMGGPPS